MFGLVNGLYLFTEIGVNDSCIFHVVPTLFTDGRFGLAQYLLMPDPGAYQAPTQASCQSDASRRCIVEVFRKRQCE